MFRQQGIIKMDISGPLPWLTFLLCTRGVLSNKMSQHVSLSHCTVYTRVAPGMSHMSTVTAHARYQIQTGENEYRILQAWHRVAAMCDSHLVMAYMNQSSSKGCRVHPCDSTWLSAAARCVSDAALIS